MFQHVFNKFFSHLYGQLCVCEVDHIDERQDAEHLWGHLIIKAYLRIWALEILAWIRAVMYTCMWWDVRGGWWTKWTKSFVEGRLKIENSMYTCFTLHLRKNTNNQCSVHTSAYVKQDGGDKMDKELCRGGEGGLTLESICPGNVGIYAVAAHFRPRGNNNIVDKHKQYQMLAEWVP